MPKAGIDILGMLPQMPSGLPLKGASESLFFRLVELKLAPPDLRGWNKGIRFFSVVYFSRGTLPTKKRGEKGHYWGT